MATTKNIVSILEEVSLELGKAYSKFPEKQASRHEGYAVLLEEVDELWDSIKQNQPKSIVREEAIQVAAMAIRLIADTLCD